MRAISYLFLALSVAAFLYLVELDDSDGVSGRGDPASTSSSAKVRNGLVFDISVHNIDELRGVLQRAEKLVSTPKSADEPANIALMLHGPEIQYFSIDKYAEYKDIVDLAARLDAYNVVELKMCETAMKDFGIKKNDIPGFIEFVPNGETELKELARRGFSIM